MYAVLLSVELGVVSLSLSIVQQWTCGLYNALQCPRFTCWCL